MLGGAYDKTVPDWVLKELSEEDCGEVGDVQLCADGELLVL